MTTASRTRCLLGSCCSLRATGRRRRLSADALRRRVTLAQGRISTSELHQNIRMSGVSLVELSREEVQQLLDCLVFEGFVELASAKDPSVVRRRAPRSAADAPRSLRESRCTTTTRRTTPALERRRRCRASSALCVPCVAPAPADVPPGCKPVRQGGAHLAGDVQVHGPVAGHLLTRRRRGCKSTLSLRRVIDPTPPPLQKNRPLPRTAASVELLLRCICRTSSTSASRARRCRATGTSSLPCSSSRRCSSCAQSLERWGGEAGWR